MEKSEERYYTKEYWINDFPSEQISRLNNYIKYFKEYTKAKEKNENEEKLNKINEKLNLYNSNEIGFPESLYQVCREVSRDDMLKIIESFSKYYYKQHDKAITEHVQIINNSRILVKYRDEVLNLYLTFQNLRSYLENDSTNVPFYSSDTHLNSFLAKNLLQPIEGLIYLVKLQIQTGWDSKTDIRKILIQNDPALRDIYYETENNNKEKKAKKKARFNFLSIEKDKEAEFELRNLLIQYSDEKYENTIGLIRNYRHRTLSMLEEIFKLLKVRKYLTSEPHLLIEQINESKEDIIFNFETNVKRHITCIVYALIQSELLPRNASSSYKAHILIKNAEGELKNEQTFSFHTLISGFSTTVIDDLKSKEIKTIVALIDSAKLF